MTSLDVSAKIRDEEETTPVEAQTRKIPPCLNIEHLSGISRRFNLILSVGRNMSETNGTFARSPPFHGNTSRHGSREPGTNMFELSEKNFRISLDTEYDLLEIRVIGKGKTVDSDEIRPNVFVHFDEMGEICGLTILEVSKILGEHKPFVVQSPHLPEGIKELVTASR